MDRRRFVAAAAAGAGSAAGAGQLALEGGKPVREKPLRGDHWGPLYYDQAERSQVMEVVDTGVLREMAARADFREDPAWVASQLIPAIKPAQAAQALEALLGLGLLVRDEGGTIRRGETTITSGHEVRALGVANYHRQMLERAAQSIEDVASEERDLSAMTVCVTHTLVPELKRRLREFREALMDVCDRETDPDVVYQMNIQLFPLTRPKGEKK